MATTNKDKKGPAPDVKVCGNCLTPEGVGSAPKLSACSRCGLVVYSAETVSGLTGRPATSNAAWPKQTDRCSTQINRRKLPLQRLLRGKNAAYV